MARRKNLKWELCLVADSKANGFDMWDEWKAPTDREAIFGWLAEGVGHMSASELTKVHEVKIRHVTSGKTYRVKAQLRVDLLDVKEERE